MSDLSLFFKCKNLKNLKIAGGVNTYAPHGITPYVVENGEPNAYIIFSYQLSILCSFFHAVFYL